jgi:hypothetical protein
MIAAKVGPATQRKAALDQERLEDLARRLSGRAATGAQPRSGKPLCRGGVAENWGPASKTARDFGKYQVCKCVRGLSGTYGLDNRGDRERMAGG